MTLRAFPLRAPLAEVDADIVTAHHAGASEIIAERVGREIFSEMDIEIRRGRNATVDGRQTTKYQRSRRPCEVQCWLEIKPKMLITATLVGLALPNTQALFPLNPRRHSLPSNLLTLTDPYLAG